jgi:hypothetical protein
VGSAEGMKGAGMGSADGQYTSPALGGGGGGTAGSDIGGGCVNFPDGTVGTA